VDELLCTSCCQPTRVLDSIERHYGTLLDGALESIAASLDALELGRDQEARSEGK
jgi:hypothetical protein